MLYIIFQFVETIPIRMKWLKPSFFHIAFTDPSEETTLHRDLLELHQLPKSTQPDPPLSSPSIYIKLQHYLPFLFNNEVC